MKILITGGTGFVGTPLVAELERQGITAMLVSRSNQTNHGTPFIPVPLDGGLFSSDLIGSVSKIVNLAGESIAGSRWNEKVRRRILASRVGMTRSIVESIRRNQEQNLPYPKVLVSASAVGYYGTHPSETFTEQSQSGNDFLADVCHRWETEAYKAEGLGVRVVCTRFGHVLDHDGGMLARVAMPFRFGVGGYLGDGQQWMSWIHRKELINIIMQALENPAWRGVYNLTTPHAVTMKEFMNVLGEALGSKSRMSVPAFAVRLLFGEMAQEVLLEGQKVFPKHLLEQGYVFKFPTLTECLADIYQ